MNKSTRHFSVSTHSFLALIELDEDWKLTDYQIVSEGHHYGVAPFEEGDGFYVMKGSSNQLAKYVTPGEIGNYKHERNIDLDDEFKFVHQISLHSGTSDHILIANTDFNNLSMVSGKGDLICKHHFNGHHSDVNHLNSVYPVSSTDFVCLLHNGYKRLSQIVWLSLEDDEKSGFNVKRTVPLWHKGCHNIHVDDDQLVYNASGAGRFVCVDLKSQKISREIEFPGHTKGLSVLDNYYLIGHSDFAKRENRMFAKGYLSVIDRKTLEVIKTVDLNFEDLPHPIGNVNEVRCLNQSDDGHFSASNRTNQLRNLKLSKADYLFRARSMYHRSKARLKKLVR